MERKMVLTDALKNQYGKCFNMLFHAINDYKEELWFDHFNYKSPVWQIVYHAIFYTNIYCGAEEKDIEHWAKEKNDYHRFDKLQEIKRIDADQIKPYTKNEMIEYLEFVKSKVPDYLSRMKPEEKCWPYWYNEKQLEFHINNIRHIEHHIAEIIERHDIASGFPYKWE
jgi:hypothetical protein